MLSSVIGNERGPGGSDRANKFRMEVRGSRTEASQVDITGMLLLPGVDTSYHVHGLNGLNTYPRTPTPLLLL
jgi:hypothetical protein